jgi:formylglycine-generating enzyme
MAWYCGNNMPNYTKPVGSKTPNAWGMFDMHGNVWEWVWDGYRPDYENLSPIDPVQDAAAGAIRVFRGGNWNSRAYVCRSAHRNANLPNYGICIFGVRPVRTAF